MASASSSGTAPPPRGEADLPVKAPPPKKRALAHEDSDLSDSDLVALVLGHSTEDSASTRSVEDDVAATASVAEAITRVQAVKALLRLTDETGQSATDTVRALSLLVHSWDVPLPTAQPQAADEDIEPREAVLLSLHGMGPVGSAERCFSACTGASALPVVAGAAR